MAIIVHIRAEDYAALDLITKVRGVSLIKVEEEMKSKKKGGRHYRRPDGKTGPVIVYDGLKDVGGEATKKEVETLLIQAGFDSTGYSPVVSTLVKAKIAERTDHGIKLIKNHLTNDQIKKMTKAKPRDK